MLEELYNFEQRVAQRLNELQPLVDEYEELKRVAERLDLNVREAAATTSRPARRTRRTTATKPKARAASSRSRPGGTQATGRERRDRVLGLIRQRPGITVGELSRELDVDAPSLYRVVRKLVSDGTVRKDGKELNLV